MNSCENENGNEENLRLVYETDSGLFKREAKGQVGNRRYSACNGDCLNYKPSVSLWAVPS